MLILAIVIPAEADIFVWYFALFERQILIGRGWHGPASTSGKPFLTNIAPEVAGPCLQEP